MSQGLNIKWLLFPVLTLCENSETCKMHSLLLTKLIGQFTELYE